MNAWASLSCLCITFWQVSIYSAAACMEKAPFHTKKQHLLESIPSEACFPEVSFPEGPILPWMPADCSLMHWGREGAGCDSIPWLCCTGRASSGPAQTRMSSVHRAAMILYLLFSSWGTGLPHHLSSSSSLSLLLSFAFNYFLISEEKEICGRKQF